MIIRLLAGLAGVAIALVLIAWSHRRHPDLPDRLRGRGRW